MQISNEKIQDFYDDYVTRQVNVGINDRHKSIQHWVEKFNVAPTAQVLEVGCGIGTQTELLARYIHQPGRILATDISEKSIEVARRRLGKYGHVEVFAADSTDHTFEGSFDLILMPDVLEHIPIELHAKLFSNLSKVLKPDGIFLIHIPNPSFLNWCHKNRPDLLQVIDQPLFTELLIPTFSQVNLQITYLESYSVWWKPYDYQVIVLRKGCSLEEFKQPQKKKSALDQFLTKAKFKLAQLRG